MKKPILAALALCYALGAAAQTPDTAAPEGYRFTDVKILPVTPVKDQSRSGTCWCYSTLSFLESEILRAGGPELDLSEMWIVRNIYFEKAVKYVRLHGSLNLAVGGQAHDVLHGIEAYGIVPEEVYPGLNYGYDKPNFDEIDAVIKAYADAVIKAGGKRSDSRLTTAWQAGLNGILDAYFGPMPGKFTYRGREYTPASTSATTSNSPHSPTTPSTRSSPWRSPTTGTGTRYGTCPWTSSCRSSTTRWRRVTRSPGEPT